MPDIDEETKYYLDLLKEFNELINEGPWDRSPFFRAIGNKLIQIRDQYRKDFNLGVVEETGMAASVANRIAKRHGLIEVFILLYNSDGDNIGKWENTIQSLKAKSINRPVYQEESTAKAALRGASNKQNEAYIAVYIHSEDIIKLPPEKIPKDRWQNPLLLLNDNAIVLHNITRFIHISGNYEVENGKLIRQSSADFL